MNSFTHSFIHSGYSYSAH